MDIVITTFQPAGIFSSVDYFYRPTGIPRGVVDLYRKSVVDMIVTSIRVACPQILADRLSTTS